MEQRTSTFTAVTMGSILAIVAVIAYVVMATLDSDASTIKDFVSFVSPWVAVLILARKTDNIEAQATRIEHNTNGTLSSHIDSVARRAAELALQNKD